MLIIYSDRVLYDGDLQFISVITSLLKCCPVINTWSTPFQHRKTLQKSTEGVWISLTHIITRGSTVTNKTSCMSEFNMCKYNWYCLKGVNFCFLSVLNNISKCLLSSSGMTDMKGCHLGSFKVTINFTLTWWQQWMLALAVSRVPEAEC